MLIAACAALTGALTRNLTATVLLGSFVFSTALCRLDVPFNFVLWITIDLVAILIVMRPHMTGRDVAVIAMFGPAWVLYLTQPSWWGHAVNLIVASQMFLTFPLRRASALVRRFLQSTRDDGNMKLAAA